MAGRVGDGAGVAVMLVIDGSSDDGAVRGVVIEVNGTSLKRKDRKK